MLALGYGIFAAMHLPIFFPLSRESSLRTASDLPYLLESTAGFTPPAFFEDGLLAFVLLIVIAVMLRARLRAHAETPLLRLAVFGCSSLNLALLIFSKKSWPPYLVLTLFPLCLLFGEGGHRRLRLVCFAAFNVVAVTTHSIWATVFGQFLAEPFHHALAQGQPMAIVFLITQILLIAGYAWLLIESIDMMLTPTPATLAAEPQLSQRGVATHQRVDCSVLKLTSRYRSTVTALPFLRRRLKLILLDRRNRGLIQPQTRRLRHAHMRHLAVRVEPQIQLHVPRKLLRIGQVRERRVVRVHQRRRLH